MMKFVLLACFFVVSVKSDASVINGAFDAVLESAKDILKSRGQDRLPVSDLDESVDETFLGITIHGKFHASGGQFGDLTTIHRTGDATLDTQGNQLILSASMGLDTLEVDFSQYSFEFLGIRSSGSIRATCSRNSLSAVISVVRQGDTCSVTLQRATITDLGGFDVHLSGEGDLNKLRNVLFSWVLNHFNNVVREQVNLHVEDALQNALQSADLCNKLPF